MTDLAFLSAHELAHRLRRREVGAREPGAPALPVGAQVVGPAFGDMDVLAFARWLEAEYHAFAPPPLAWAAAAPGTP